MGMDREETLATRYGEMLDMIACMAIENGASPKKKTKKKAMDEILAMR